MSELSMTASIDAPVAEVFAYVNDHTNTVDYVHGLTRWEPQSEKTDGVGAVFAAAMQVGPTQLESTIEINAWEQDRVIGWVPVKGFQQSGRWVFEPTGDATTDATFTVDLTFPGGIAGRLLAKTAGPAIKGNVGRTVQGLKQRVEARRGQ